MSATQPLHFNLITAAHASWMDVNSPVLTAASSATPNAGPWSQRTRAQVLSNMFC